jgi:hypothetical protein
LEAAATIMAEDDQRSDEHGRRGTAYAVRPREGEAGIDAGLNLDLGLTPSRSLCTDTNAWRIIDKECRALFGDGLALKESNIPFFIQTGSQ